METAIPTRSERVVTGLFFHACPVMLQRTLRGRVQPLGVGGG